MTKHKIGIIGAGYVGTACEIGFSSMPNTDVSVYDKYKPTDSLRTVVDNSSILFICVPTPMLGDKSCDTSAVTATIHQIAKYAHRHKTIVIKSTVTPGTTNELQLKYPKHTIIYNPEFLTRANFIADFCDQPRIILGRSIASPATNREAIELFYNDFVKTQKVPAKIIWTVATYAEIAKFAINGFLATKVAFFNEIAEISKSLGAIYSDELINLIGGDNRIGTSHMQVPGPDGMHGFGNNLCKELNALIYAADQHDIDQLILGCVWTKNLVIREEYDWLKKHETKSA